MQVKLAQWSILVLVGINFSGEKFFGAQVSVEPRSRGVQGGDLYIFSVHHLKILKPHPVPHPDFPVSRNPTPLPTPIFHIPGTSPRALPLFSIFPRPHPDPFPDRGGDRGKKRGQNHKNRINTAGLFTSENIFVRFLDKVVA